MTTTTTAQECPACGNCCTGDVCCVAADCTCALTCDARSDELVAICLLRPGHIGDHYDDRGHIVREWLGDDRAPTR